MKENTKINILCSAVLLGVCIALAMIALEREENRMLIQEKSCIEQGYQIGE